MGRSNAAAASGIQAAGPGGESTGFPIIGAFVLGLSVILVVLSVLVAINRRRMAAYQRRRAMA
jgi:poly(3-hydroxybutyrate) depolymerase